MYWEDIMEHRKPWLRVIAMIMILLVLPQQPAVAAQSAIVQAQPGTSTETLSKKANLYQKKNTGSKVLKKLKVGAAVSVLSKNESWVKVKYDGKTGYIKASAFEKVAVKEKSAQPGTNTTVVTHDARLYKKASGSAASIAVARKTEVLVLSQSGNWCKVNADGKAGYMKASAFTAIAAKKTKRYKKAEAKGTVIDVKKGAKLTILGWGKDWTKVIHNNKTGYIKTAHIDFPKAASDATEQISEKLSAKPATTPSPTATLTSKATTTLEATSNTYMYQKASTSAKRVKVKKGASVIVKSTNKTWAKVTVGSKSGYMKVNALAAPAQSTTAPTATPTPKPTATPSTYTKLKPGSKGTKVNNLQTALEALGYLDIAPSGKYTTTTTTAVREFQGQAGIKKTGTADNKTQLALYGSNPPKSKILSARLTSGNKGNQVKRLQTRLRNKGYFKGTVNSKYNAATKTAVEKFQRQVGITADGIAGATTLAKLFAASAPKYDANAVAATPTPAPTPTPKPTSTPNPTATPAPAPTSSASNKQKIEQMIEVAMNQLGKPYVYATSGPNTFDCSGFIVYAFKQIGMVMPHSAYQMGYQVGTKVSKSELKRGDLVFWNTVSDSDLCDHVGIYLGNGQAIHASSGTGRVIISSITSGYYSTNFSWGRSVL